MSDEAAIALTDLALALACAGCAVHAARGPRRRIRPWATLLLVSVGIGALIGGAAHGLTADRADPLFRWLWSATMVTFGGTALALYGLAAALSLGASAERRVMRFGALLLVPYVVLVIAYRAPFWWALAAYLPALALFLLALLGDTWRRRDASHMAAIASVGVTVLAALVQRQVLDTGPLNHNVAYHLIQLIAMLLIPLWTRLEAPTHAQPP